MIAALVPASPALAFGPHLADAKIGAENYVFAKGRSLERRAGPGLGSRIVISRVARCRRVASHLYDCPGSYEISVKQSGTETSRYSCAETVRVTVSHRFAGLSRARSRGFDCRF